ncbi:hypothetical protein FACS1894170_07020 [Planctomycetales bacterium]|nr:hypothetical protein FACS1894170_07020 [Planctomycetales bacterium]
MAANSIKAGSAYVEIFAYDNKLTSALKKASVKLEAFSKKCYSIAKKAALHLAVIGVPIALATKQFMNFGDKIEKMSHRVGMSARSLSELAYAAQINGTSIETLEGAITKMSRKLAEARMGNDTAREAFERLGLSINDLSKMSPEKRFEAVVGALGKVKDANIKTALTMDIFGKSATQLMPMINGGTEALRKMRIEARELGYSMSDEDVKAAADLTDAITRLKTAFIGIAMTIGKTVAPTLTSLANSFVKVAKYAVLLIDMFGPLINTVVRIATISIGTTAALAMLGAVAGLLASKFFLAARVLGIFIGTLVLLHKVIIGQVLGGIYAFIRSLLQLAVTAATTTVTAMYSLIRSLVVLSVTASVQAASGLLSLAKSMLFLGNTAAGVTQAMALAFLNPVNSIRVLASALAFIINPMNLIRAAITAVSAAFSYLIGGTGTAAAAFLGLSNPIGWVIMAVTALIAAFLYFSGYGSQIGTYILNVWTNVSTGIMNAFTIVSAYIMNFFSDIYAFVMSWYLRIAAIISGIVTIFQTVFSTVLSIVKTMFSTLLNAVSTVLQYCFGWIMPYITPILSFIGDKLLMIAGIAKDAFFGIFNVLGSVIGWVSRRVMDVYNTITWVFQKAQEWFDWFLGVDKQTKKLQQDAQKAKDERLQKAQDTITARNQKSAETIDKRNNPQAKPQKEGGGLIENIKGKIPDVKMPGMPDGEKLLAGIAMPDINIPDPAKLLGGENFNAALQGLGNFKDGIPLDTDSITGMGKKLVGDMSEAVGLDGLKDLSKEGLDAKMKERLDKIQKDVDKKENTLSEGGFFGEMDDDTQEKFDSIQSDVSKKGNESSPSDSGADKDPTKISKSAAGTFNAAAAQSLMTSGPMDKVAKNTEETAKYIKKLYEKPNTATVS